MRKRFDDAAEVITSDGENIGQLSGIEKDSLFVYKKGLLTDEQFKIPASSISEEASTPDSVRLKLSEEELKHGREFLQAAPNSNLVHGDSGDNEAVLRKQVIQYEPFHKHDGQTEDSLTRGSSPIPVEASSEDYPIPDHFSCDMCSAKFASARSLDEHRSGAHTGPRNP